MLDFNYKDIDFPSEPVFPENAHVVKILSNSPNCINSAIEKAPFNSIIVIPEGVYTENLVIKNRIKLIGQGKVVIQSDNSNDTVTIDSSAVYFENITITSNMNQAASPVNLLSGTALFINCILSSLGVPVVLTHSTGTLFIINSRITSKDSPCIKLAGKTKCEIKNTLVANTTKSGILCLDNSQLKLYHVLITKCEDSGIVSMGDSSVVLEDCKLDQNGGNAIELNTNSPNNMIKNCTIINHEKGCGISCSGNGNLLVVQCNLSNFLAGISAANGFAVTTNKCSFSNSSRSALVNAINMSTLNMNEDILSGECPLAILCSESSSATINKVNIKEIPKSGIIIDSNSTLTMTDTNISSVQENAIEVKKSSKITATNCVIENIGMIGVVVHDDCSISFNKTNVSKCTSTCTHVSNCLPPNEVTFTECSFTNSDGNGMNIKNSNPSFSKCVFSHNLYAGLQLRNSTQNSFISCNFTQNKVVGCNILDNSIAYFEDCSFDKNSGTGLSLQNSKTSCITCVFKENLKMGLCIFGGDNGLSSFGSCMFKRNLSFGCQIEQPGTDVTFQDCTFSSHTQSGAIMVSNGPNVNFNNCVFHKNKNSHIEGRESSTITVESSEFARTQCGIGIIVSSSSILNISKSILHNEKQSTIVSGEKGEVHVTNCDIYDCKLSGIYLLKDSSGTIMNCKIHDNNLCGIQVSTTSCTISDNEIYDNKHYGIQISKGNKPTLGNNQFHGNTKNDVNYSSS